MNRAGCGRRCFPTSPHHIPDPDQVAARPGPSSPPTRDTADRRPPHTSTVTDHLRRARRACPPRAVADTFAPPVSPAAPARTVRATPECRMSPEGPRHRHGDVRGRGEAGQQRKDSGPGRRVLPTRRAAVVGAAVEPATPMTRRRIASPQPGIGIGLVSCLRGVGSLQPGRRSSHPAARLEVLNPRARARPSVGRPASQCRPRNRGRRVRLPVELQQSHVCNIWMVGVAHGPVHALRHPNQGCHMTQRSGVRQAML
ncbi:hypothetical protein C8E86_5437 [Catellatospora citrea]|nr:hypothetical protein C8E86_5437 [Catellatospora citrea]